MAASGPENTTNPLPAKHIQLQKWLTEGIHSGRLVVGDKIPSEHALAIQFGFSRQTVRHAIGHMESAGLLERRRGSGTYVAQTFPRRKTNRNVAVMTTYQADYIFPEIIRGIDSVLAPASCSLTLHITRNSAEREAECLHDILSRAVDGLVVEGTKSAFPNPNLPLYRHLAQRGIPVVFINGCYAGLDAVKILFDDEAAGHMATRCLLEAGHREIGGLFKVDDIQGHRRFEGYLRAHHEADLKIREERVLWFTTEDLSHVTAPEHDPVLNRRFEGVTGIVSYNDQVALGLMEAFRRLGRNIPENLSIIGIDDSEIARHSQPPLTTIAHPCARLGVLAATSLISMMNGETRPPDAILPPRLVVRASVVPPPPSQHKSNP